MNQKYLPTREEWILDEKNAKISEKEWNFAKKIWDGLASWCKSKKKYVLWKHIQPNT